MRVRVLGRFEVLVGGKPVPLTARRSRQARSLLKILIGRRGSPVARGELAVGLLWPDDDAHRTGHRLSVLLSAVRCVLDPSRLWGGPVDYHLRADVAGICLDIEHVAVDVEDLIRDAGQATALLRDGDTARAREILSDVDAMYLGDAFSDEPYEDWSIGLREQARTVWLGALRTLADLSRSDHDVDQGGDLPGPAARGRPVRRTRPRRAGRPAGPGRPAWRGPPGFRPVDRRHEDDRGTAAGSGPAAARPSEKLLFPAGRAVVGGRPEVLEKGADLDPEILGRAPVVAGTAVGDIGAVVAGEFVVALVAVQAVIVVAAQEQVVAVAAVDDVRRRVRRRGCRGHPVR